MIQYLIVGDEPLAHELIKKFAEDLPHLELCKQCYNALEAMTFLRDHTVDLIFLDLHMPKLKGFDFLRTLSSPPKIIVTTAHKEFALEGYELNIDDYLLKPFSFERFIKAVNNTFPKETPRKHSVLTDLSPPIHTATKRLFVKGDKQYHQLHIGHILFIEAYGNYTKVYLAQEMILSHVSISFYEKKLSNSDFLRVHKSFIVAIRQIDRIAGNRIYIGEYEVAIGQTYKQRVMDLL